MRRFFEDDSLSDRISGMDSDNQLSISDELRSMIGRELPGLTKSTKIDESFVADFTEAVEHPNARWETEWEGEDRAAVPEKKRDTIVPPSILWTRRVSYRGHWIRPLLGMVPARGVDAGGEWEVSKQVRVGDIITAKSKLAEVSEIMSKSLGKMLMVVVETTYTNQEGQIVGTYKHRTLRW
jgi:hypothetical protein